MVLVTGCSSGIGECIVRKLPNHGYSVIASCRKQHDVERLIAEGINTIQLDLADANSVSHAAGLVLQMTGNDLYGLINNGAYGQAGAVIDLSRDALQEQFETNVFGTQQLTNLVLPSMLVNNQGRIVQISSILGFIGLSFRGAYNASKFALEGLTDTMRLEHRQSNVKFSLVEPGPIESRFRHNSYQKLLQHIDRDNSVFRDLYHRVEQRLCEVENTRFTLPADAVLDATVHALGNKRPKVRYRVTTPTKIAMLLKRILTDRQMDAFLSANSDK